MRMAETDVMLLAVLPPTASTRMLTASGWSTAPS